MSLGTHDCREFHQWARAIFDHALSAVDPRTAVKHAIETEFDLSGDSIYAIAIGKAGTSMAMGLEDALGERLTAGVLTSSYPAGISQRWQSFAGGHPLPNEASYDAALAACGLLHQANNEEATVIFLISGGGSAMLEWPATDEISLTDLQVANQILISCGARIEEVNAVRRAFSAVKGGGLARWAPRARQFTLIVSDTNPGDEASVASGPTLPAPANAPEAIEVVERYHLETLLPASIVNAVRRAIASSNPINGSHLVVLDNETAIEAAWRKALDLGWLTARPSDICEQPIQEGCDLLLENLMWRPAGTIYCAVSGGEFSCPVRGDGRGGRNLETVLRCAIILDEQRGKGPHFVVLSAGTDGIDGNSPAAGAIADETTIERARNLGLDANDYLARSDSYTFFDRIGDLVITGPTGTNVRDLRILLRSP